MREGGKRGARARVYGIVATMAVLAVTAGTLALSNVPSGAAPVQNGPVGATSAQAHTGTIAPGTKVQPRISRKSYTPTARQQRLQQQRIAALAKLPKPSMGTHTSKGDVSTANHGPATSPSSSAKASSAPGPLGTTPLMFKQNLV